MHCETAVAGVSGGPYGSKTGQKPCVKEAEKALRLFWFEKNKMSFFRIITTKGSALPPSIRLSDRKLLIYATITPKSSKFASVISKSTELN